VKGTWREGWGPWRIGRKGLEMGMSFHRGPAGEHGKGLIYQDFERYTKGDLGMELFSLKRLSAEGIWGGLLYWGPWKMC
jgi:hypothetical protein